MTLQLKPEVRQELPDSITHACVLWTEDIMKGYFPDPTDSVAQQIVLEAYAKAITTLVKPVPDKKSVLQTFILELQDLTNKELV